MVLFIFAGAAAEFSLNKAVDWLYFTGRLPADPIGRLYSTLGYAKRIIFAPEAEALKAIDTITAIHKGVETARNATIPEWAYRDVLFMLMDYSIKSFELLERQLTEAEKEEIYSVFYRMGARMGLTGLPETYQLWLPCREAHMHQDLAVSKYTPDLFTQYKKHLRPMRYRLMLQVQALLVPNHIKNLLALHTTAVFPSILAAYKLIRFAHLDNWLEPFLLPRGKGK